MESLHLDPLTLGGARRDGQEVCAGQTRLRLRVLDRGSSIVCGLRASGRGQRRGQLCRHEFPVARGARERGDVGKELRLLRREIDGDLEDYPLRRKAFGKDYTKADAGIRSRNPLQARGGREDYRGRRAGTVERVLRTRPDTGYFSAAWLLVLLRAMENWETYLARYF